MARLGQYSRVSLDRSPYRVKQVLMRDRLRQEIDCAGLHCSNRHRHICMTADKDDWQRVVRLQEFVIKIQPALSWQPNIKNQARIAFRAELLTEVLNRRE